MRSIKKQKNIFNLSQGFTLIEMAAVVMILGLIIAGFTPVYKLYIENNAIHKTQDNVDNITAAIGSFRAVNGRYPCPASLVAQRGAANYGREDCSNYNGTIATGTCDLAGAGICRELSVRAPIEYLDPFTVNNPAITAPPVVRVGAVPFRELNIPEKDAYDGYSNRITYAVTENLMDDFTFRADQGGIEIQDDKTPPATLLDPPASAHFLILSFGKNGNGAFNKIGTSLPCPVTGPEASNCDVGLSQYKLVQHSSSNTAEYDDVMTYFMQNEVPLWQLSPEKPGAITQKPKGDVGFSFISGSDGFTGSTKQPPNISTKQVQIRGDLRAADEPTNPAINGGKVMTNNLCPTSGLAGNDCFNPALLAGNIADATGGMRCPEDDPDGAGAFMVGIANGAPICSDDIDIKCPPGQILSGIKADGTIACMADTYCPTTTVNLCGTPQTLTSAPSGSPAQTIVAGLTAIQKFWCNGGNWQALSGSLQGVCSCTPLPPQVTNNVPCGWGFTGTVTQTSNYICPTAASPRGTGPSWSTPSPPVFQSWMASWTYPSGSTCQCVGANASQNIYCPAGKTAVDAGGNPVTVQTRSFVCSSLLGGAWSAWTPPYTCQCSPPAITTQDQWVLCGGNTNPGSKKKQTRTFNTTSCGWSAWADSDISACVCTTSWSEIRTTDPCPVGQVGAVTNRYDYNCSATPAITQISSTCTAPPPVTCYWSSNDYSGSAQNAAGPRLGTSAGQHGNPNCTCGETASQCHSGAPGNFSIYQNCVCGG